MRVNSTDSVELEVHDLGGDGPPVLLVHATGFHGLVWEPLAAHVTGFHRFSVDMRAHGDSTAPLGRPLDWEGFADDVLAVVDALGLKNPHAVGHSKGGAALLLAEERRPGTFSSIYCWEPVVMPPEIAIGHQPDNPLSNGARRRRPTFASHDEAYENYASKPPFSGLDPVALRAYVDHGFAPTDEGTVTLKCLPDNEADVYAHGTAHQAFASLGLVRCPVTIAVGVEDSVPAIFGRPIADALPAGRIESFPELGHFGPLENPRLVAESILRAFAGD